MNEQEPIVLIGGFGSHWSDYRTAARLLASITGRRVFIAGITRLSWLLASVSDYSLLVDRTHAAVRHALRQTDAQKAILIGHSAGGIVGRAYLGDRKIKPYHHAHRGHERVSRLFMVGSPLRAPKNASRRGIRAAAWVDEAYPGAYYAPDVQYVNVRGRYVEGKPNGTLRERQAYYNYRFIAQNGAQWGDGVVPLSLSELEGANTLELDGVGHSPGWGRWFFEDAEVIRAWWCAAQTGAS
jgi:pimeloyl-ACP methyl ester carboxylesterase